MYTHVYIYINMYTYVCIYLIIHQALTSADFQAYSSVFSAYGNGGGGEDYIGNTRKQVIYIYICVYIYIHICIYINKYVRYLVLLFSHSNGKIEYTYMHTIYTYDDVYLIEITTCELQNLSPY
jgi:hypothetical protein